MMTSKKSTPTPRILGIDPGYDRLGVAVLERLAGQERVIFSTCLVTNQRQTMAERYLVLGQALIKILAEYQPQQVALEKIFFTNNRKTATQVAEIRGLLIFLAAQAGAGIVEFSPPEIKLAITGYGRADKAQVTAMVKRLVALPAGQRLDDEYDAIAVALTALAKSRGR